MSEAADDAIDDSLESEYFDIEHPVEDETGAVGRTSGLESWRAVTTPRPTRTACLKCGKTKLCWCRVRGKWTLVEVHRGKRVIVHQCIGLKR